MNHGRSFREHSESITDAEAAGVLLDPESAPALDEADRAILRLAGKITLHPETIEEGDIESLRAAGLSEENIVDAIACACYRIYANRLNYAMGEVEREPEGPLEILRALAEIRAGDRA